MQQLYWNFFPFKDNEKSNRHREINNLSKWLLNLRHSVGHSDVNAISYPDMSQCMRNLNTSSDDHIIVCHLSQKQMLWKANDRHVPQKSDQKVLTPNLMIKISSITLSEDFCDNLSILCDTKINNRQVLDKHCAENSLFMKLYHC